MKQAIQEKYKFDLELGHYIYLNEDDNNSNNNNDNSGGDNGDQSSQSSSPTLPNIETPEITQMKQILDDKLNKCEDDIQTASNVLSQLKTKLSQEIATVQKAINSGQAVTMATLNKLYKQILQQEINLENKKFNKAKAEHDGNLNIYNAQDKLIESVTMMKLPGKYMHLNESNIHMAKIYINSLVGEESWHLLHGMVDVKKCFGNSYLLYGKDKKGYFAVCIDQEDFDRMYNALQDIGYSRDIIIDAIMPQIFDRGDFVKTTNNNK